MLVSFDPLILLVWIFLTCFLPGAILSFGLFKTSRFIFFEKILIGFGIGLILLPLIPFLLYLLIGIKFSYTIALLSAAVFYIASIAIFVKNKAYEDFKIPKSADFFTKEKIIALLILLIIIISFIIRYLPYSPVFFELDPYYYTNVASQILTFGENPINDQTAWYPDLEVSHRIIPTLSYLEALWYSFYTSGAEYDNMLLSVIASMYPPIMAALSVFFLYLFISVFYAREWGVVAAGIAAFVPIFVFKTLSGVQEVQPYAFFAIAFFLSMYAIMLKDKNRIYAVLAGLGFLAVVLGSSSEVVILTVLMLYIPLQSIYLYLREENIEELKTFLINNAIVFAIGGILASMILKGIFTSGALSFSNSMLFGMIIAFTALLYAIRLKILDKQMQRIIFSGIIILGLLLFLFSPLGTLVKNYAGSAAGIAQYNQPLDRTIAEQKPAATNLAGEMGLIAMAPSSILGLLLTPISAIPILNEVTNLIALTLGGVLDAVIAPFSFLINFILAIIVVAINAVLGTSLEITEKNNSMLLLWIALFCGALIYSFFRLAKKEESYIFLFAALIFPPLIIGLIKAKYTIYAAFLMAAGIAFIFAELKNFLDRFISDVDLRKLTYSVLLVLAGLTILLQFAFSAGGFAPTILSQSYKVRFQDNPAAFTNHFSSICTNLAAQGYTEEALCSQYSQMGRPICGAYDENICTIAADPVAYANKGTNEQYSTKLCYYSLISNILQPTNEEIAAADLRCRGLSDYWIETMEWMNTNTPKNARFTSWWDYGHWTNYFGERNTVLRNEHASKFMIGEVAHAYLAGSPGELASFMKSRDSEYAIFDIELLAGGGSLGGKYGALNYLQCARNNLTDVNTETSVSVCEADYLWETILVPNDPTGQTCTISKAGNKTGILAYKAYWSRGTTDPYKYTPYYPDTIFGIGCHGSWLNDPNYLSICQNTFKMNQAYCIGETLLSNGEMGFGSYLLNETYPNGDLKLNKAIFTYVRNYDQTSHLGNATSVTLMYTTDKMFLENGIITDGYTDAPDGFYKSNLYRAIFLDEIPGFTKVFETKDGSVKIFKVN